MGSMMVAVSMIDVLSINGGGAGVTGVIGIGTGGPEQRPPEDVFGLGLGLVDHPLVPFGVEAWEEGCIVITATATATVEQLLLLLLLAATAGVHYPMVHPPRGKVVC